MTTARRALARSASRGRCGSLRWTGRTHEGRCDVPLGHPARPMSAAQLRAKFVGVRGERGAPGQRGAGGGDC